MPGLTKFAICLDQRCGAPRQSFAGGAPDVKNRRQLLCFCKASAVYGFTVHPPPGESMVPPACVAWCNMTGDPKSFLVDSNVASLQQLFNG